MMQKEVSIGIIGDFNPGKYASHKATNEALQHAADSLSLRTCIIWMPTESFISEDGLKKLELFDSLWASSGSPYTSMEGALNAINRARLVDKPFLAT
jgi:CTP synthase (UTP-ammonia lyase)